MNTIKKFALPGLAALAFTALIVGSVGAFRGPTAGQVAAQAAAQADSRETDEAEILSAINNTSWSDTDKEWLSSLIAAQDGFTNADLQVILEAIQSNALSADEVRQIVAEEVAAAPAPTEPAAAPDTGGTPAVTETPTAPVETRTELQPCPGYESKSYNGAVDGNNVTDSRDPEGFMNVKCFLIVPPANIEVEDVEAWYASITKIEFTVVGGLPRSAFLGSNGNVSLILDAWTYVNATTELPVITVDVAVPSVAAPYLTVGEILSGYHPAGPGHNGYYVYIAYTVDVQALGADKALAWITTQ